MLKLNGRKYTRIELQQLCLRYRDQDDWLGDIFRFIDEWLDQSTDSIQVQTSGSTGVPKIIPLKKQHLIQSAIRTQAFFNLTSDDKALLCLPARYIAGKMMIVRAFVVGYDLITVAPSANPFEQLAQPIDFTAITPYQLSSSLETLRGLNIRNVIVGGAEVPPQLEARLQQLPSAIYATYGMTETGSHVALRPINGNNASPLYEALPDVTFSVDQHMRLIIQADYLTYSPLQTNDVVELIDSKHFRWLGRYDHVINSGGIKIFPEEVERIIAPFIPYSFFIASQPDEVFSEVVCLYIERSSPLSETEQQALLQQIKPLLTSYQLPKRIVVLPRFIFSASGKLLRKETLLKYQ
ncbi:MAG: AMP-binding protein [Bacteroidales bacterium]